MSNPAKLYRVNFYNELVGGYGHVFHPCQRTVEIRSAQIRSVVIESAKRLFEDREAVPNWELHANRVELIEVYEK